MKRFFLVVCVLLLAGCASSGQARKESISEANSRQLREADDRLRNLESSVAALDSQVAALNNRAYEVRAKNGQKTGMTVVPIVPPLVSAAKVQDAQSKAPGTAAPAPVPSAESVKSPGTSTAPDKTLAAASSEKLIDPAAAPAPMPPRSSATARTDKTAAAASAPASRTSQSSKAGSAAQTAQAGKNTGAPIMLGLPPAEAPVVSPPLPVPVNPPPASSAASGAPVPARNPNAVPVPSLPSSGLALPPEHPGLPPAELPQAGSPAPAPVAASSNPAPVPVSAPAPAAVSGPKAVQGEDAAYKAALQPAMAGRSTEGISRLQDFLQQYPNGRYAPNADYWIGECLYAQGKYKEALDHFQRVSANYPKHHKNADALLKTAMCMNRLGDKDGASQAYKTLLASFPTSEAAGRVRGRGAAQ